MTGASPGLVDEASVLIVGGGPAGLAAATELRRRGVEGVVVLERERDAGGIPRHASHQGFGIRDLYIPMSGPRYARRCATTARAAGAEILTETMVTRWSPNGPMEITGPRGRWSVNPNAVLLATGCRERPRSARLVPGTRPQGVMTTATLQQLVYLERRRLNGGGLIVGAEHVSFSAVATLAHGGARPIGLVTELPRHQSLGPFRAGARIRHGARLWTRTRVTAIAGEHSVEEVELTELESGEARRLGCNLVVFTANWIPDHELAVMAGIELDPGTRGPAVDAALRTSRQGVFAAGNLLQGAEPADIAALSGRHAAAAAARYLASPRGWPVTRPRIVCRAPLLWISPNIADPGAGAPLRRRFALRSSEFVTRPRIEVEQDRRPVWSGSLRRLVPGRSALLSSDWVERVDPDGGPVEVGVRA